jgi:protein-S-isoprenylcysteine O-methyltransferase Ste14
MMMAGLNFVVMVVAGGLMLYFYLRSVRPAALEQRIGPEAYARCARDRKIAMVLMFVLSANYVLYYFYPLPVPLPRTFPWPWWVSAVIAALIAAPSGVIVILGTRAAGEESLTPKKEHTLYGGIYEKIRHPQAYEVFFWWVIAFLLHSPFLALFSFVWLPVWYAMVMVEERDLILRYGQTYEDYRARTGAFLPRRRA